MFDPASVKNTFLYFLILFGSLHNNFALNSRHKRNNLSGCHDFPNFHLLFFTSPGNFLFFELPEVTERCYMVHICIGSRASCVMQTLFSQNSEDDGSPQFVENQMGIPRDVGHVSKLATDSERVCSGVSFSFIKTSCSSCCLECQL
jgi:hypothetical protein